MENKIHTSPHNNFNPCLPTPLYVKDTANAQQIATEKLCTAPSTKVSLSDAAKIISHNSESEKNLLTELSSIDLKKKIIFKNAGMVIYHSDNNNIINLDRQCLTDPKALQLYVIYKEFLPFFTENINKKIYDNQFYDSYNTAPSLNGVFKDSQNSEIFCRHLAFEQLKLERTYQEVFASEENIRRSSSLMANQFDNEKVILKANAIYQFDLDNLGNILHSLTNNMANTDVKKMLFFSHNHAMTLTVKAKSNGLLVELYDPNETLSHRNAIFKDRDSIKRLKIDNLLPSWTLYQYFEDKNTAVLYIYEDPANLPEKIKIRHIDFSFSTSREPVAAGHLIHHGAMAQEIVELILNSSLSAQRKADFVEFVAKYTLYYNPNGKGERVLNYIFDSYYFKDQNAALTLFDNAFQAAMEAAIIYKANDVITSLFNLIPNLAISSEQKTSILEKMIASPVIYKDYANIVQLLSNALINSGVASGRKANILEKLIPEAVRAAVYESNEGMAQSLLGALANSGISNEQRTSILKKIVLDGLISPVYGKNGEVVALFSAGVFYAIDINYFSDNSALVQFSNSGYVVLILPLLAGGRSLCALSRLLIT